MANLEMVVEAIVALSNAALRNIRAKRCAHGLCKPVGRREEEGKQPQLTEWCSQCGALRVTVGANYGPWQLPRLIDPD